MYAIRSYYVISALTPSSESAGKLTEEYLRFGPSPRAIIALIMAAKTTALADKRYNCCFEDVSKFALPVLRHRLILNFEGEESNLSTDDIICQTLEGVHN